MRDDESYGRDVLISVIILETRYDNINPRYPTPREFEQSLEFSGELAI